MALPLFHSRTPYRASGPSEVASRTCAASMERHRWHRVSRGSMTSSTPSRSVPAAYARSRGSEFVQIEAAGYINVDSGHGPWPFGLALLQSLLDDALRPAAVPAHA